MSQEENCSKTTRPADPWSGPGVNRLKAWISMSNRADFYYSRSDHLRFGRILGHFLGRSHFTFDQSTKVQTILVLLETSKNEGEELYWCFVVLKWVNYKNVLHRKMCNLGQTLSHVWLQHTDTCVTRQIHQNKMIGTLKIPKNVLVPRLCNTNIFLKCTFFRIKK